MGLAVLIAPTGCNVFQGEKMYTALYRAQRPEVFSEVLGQDHIVKILRHQIATDTVSHAYLFCGTRGTGKTTTARILAKAVNCTDADVSGRPCGVCDNCLSIKEGTFMDVVEIDAASNNGVDNIRELRESVKYPPAVGRKKVYIIDEVHMLSTGAFNALLKTLEEPPENVIFILATTEPQKLPQTIMSRCMRLDFRRVPASVLMNHMRRICEDRGVTISESALRLISSNADGSVRDGLSLLDQCLSAGDKELDRDTVLEFLGTVSEEFYIELTEKVLLHNPSEALVLLDNAIREGKDAKQLISDWMAHYRNLLMTKYIKNPEDMLNMSTENIDKLRAQSDQISLDEINAGIVTLAKTSSDARYSTQPRILMELAIVILATGLGQGAAVQTAAPQQAFRQAAARPAAASKPAAFADQQPQTSKAPAPAGVQPQASKPSAPAEVPPWEDEPAPAENQAGSDGQEALFADMAEGDYGEPSGQTAAAVEAEMPKPPEKAAKPSSAQYDQQDLDEIWNDIFEAGEGIKGSFNLLRLGTYLAGINEKEFKIIAQNDNKKDYVMKNEKELAQMMEDRVGRKLKLVCVTEKQAGEMTEEEEKIERAAEEVSELLGIKPRIE